ncbi:MAG: glycosyltransferase [Vitreoscilla sp.]|nr:glycosyltransferase [Vitreoscilla sp.]
MSLPPTASAQSATPGGPFRVALVMIARDEAGRIERALSSMKPHVDEMWVLDTGSRDDTVARARAAGARIGLFPWVDDFSAARNAALKLANADWHLVLDADEWLADGAEVLAALRHTRPDFVGTVRVDSQDDSTPGTPAQHAGAWISRLLPGSVRYAGRVHEQPVHLLPVRRLHLTLGHDGYRGSALAAKAGRNRALLERTVADQPDDAYYWYQLGKDHDVYGRHAEALDGFDRAQALLPADKPLPAWMHDLFVRSLHALKCLRRHADGVERAGASMPRWSDSPDFFFALGDLLLDWAANEPERAGELVPMIEGAWQRCLAIGERPDLEGAVAGRGSHLAAHNLAVLYDGLGRADDAARCRAMASPSPRR